MVRSIDFILIVVALTDFMLLGSSRLGQCVTLLAWQGAALSLLPLLSPHPTVTLHLVVLVGGNFALKVLLYPRLLRTAIQRSNAKREVEPLVGYTISLLFGLLLMVIATWVGARASLLDGSSAALGFPVFVLTIGTGLFLIMSRRKAITQLMGYLVFENGILAFGVLYALSQPVMVELGVMLDVFVAVFLMGIIIFHISRDFEHIDTDRLSELHDLDAMSPTGEHAIP